jgi:hypothetical protein
MKLKEAIDQETLHLIIPSKIARVVDLLSRECGGDAVAQLKKFYESKTYAELSDETSKYWWFSPAELCELYHRETETEMKGTSARH